MTQQTKRRTKWLATAGAVLLACGTLYGMRQPLQGTGRAMLDVPSKADVSSLSGRVDRIESRLDIHDDSINAALRLIRQSNCIAVAQAKRAPVLDCLEKRP